MYKKTRIQFLDKLLVAMMYSVQSLFLLHYDRYFSLKETHKQTCERFSTFTRNGNLNTKYSNHYGDLIRLRKKNKIEHISENKIDSKLKKLKKLTEDVLEQVENMVTSLTISRQVPIPNCIELRSDELNKKSFRNYVINEIIRSYPMGGIAAENKEENATKVDIRFRINCKDKFHLDAKTRMIHEFLENYVYPEIFIRVNNGVLGPNFKLNAAHFILFGNRLRNKILLNGKVRAMAHVKFKKKSIHKEGQGIVEDEIDDVLGLYPNTQVPEDAASVILFKCNGLWHVSVDLIFNRKRTRSRFETAKMFLDVAKYCLEKKIWNPLFDNLFSATELSIQSILLLHHHPTFSVKQTHDETKKLFFSHASHGNIDLKYSKHYTKLTDLRPQARYLQNIRSNKLKVSDAQIMVSLTSELMEQVQKLLELVDLSKKPPSGEYISIT
jgi:HEPN domain-containing protein